MSGIGKAAAHEVAATVSRDFKEDTYLNRSLSASLEPLSHGDEEFRADPDSITEAWFGYQTTPNTGARHQVMRTRDSEISITHLERQTVRRKQ